MTYRNINCLKCGKTITINTGAFTNPCENDFCDADYNWSGQLLAPRSQWGEETGESAFEIMMPISDEDWNE